MKFFLSTLLSFSMAVAFGQGTGPGGVGTSSTNILWLRAGAGAFTDAGTTEATDGDNVQQWNDQSGNNNHVSQSTLSFRPNLETNIVNGRSVIRFNGSSDRLTADLGSPGAPLTVIAVTSFDAVNQGSDDYDFVVNLGAGSGTNANLSIGRGASNSGFPDDYYSWDGNNNRTGPNLTGATFQILSAVHQSSSTFHELYLDATSQSVTDYSGSVSTDGTITIGAFPSPINHYLDGDVAELIVFNTIDSAERTIIENYLSSKYNVSIASGKDLYAYDGSYGYEVAGIGQYSTNHTTNDALGSGIVRIFNPSALG